MCVLVLCSLLQPELPLNSHLTWNCEPSKPFVPVLLLSGYFPQLQETKLRQQSDEEGLDLSRASHKHMTPDQPWEGVRQTQAERSLKQSMLLEL